jgi:hypothetical protein
MLLRHSAPTLPADPPASPAIWRSITRRVEIFWIDFTVGSLTSLGFVLSGSGALSLTLDPAAPTRLGGEQGVKRLAVRDRLRREVQAASIPLATGAFALHPSAGRAYAATVGSDPIDPKLECEVLWMFTVKGCAPFAASAAA